MSKYSKIFYEFVAAKGTTKCVRIRAFASFLLAFFMVNQLPQVVFNNVSVTIQNDKYYFDPLTLCVH